MKLHVPRPWIAGAMAISIVLIAAAPGFTYGRPGQTQLIGKGTRLWGPSISHDGRFVAFSTDEDYDALGDENGVRDVYLRDRKRGLLRMISIATTGGPSAASPCVTTQTPPREVNWGSHGSSVSADGRSIAFYSCAANLVPGDTNLTWDVFVHDHLKGTTERVNIGALGLEANPGSESVRASISPDGRYVVFRSDAVTLLSTATNGADQIFRKDRVSGRLDLVSISPSGEAGAGNSEGPSLSGDGRYVAFSSYSSNLVQDSLPRAVGVEQAFVRDLVTRSTRAVSGPPPAFTWLSNTTYSGGRALSRDGRFVTFLSGRSDLVPNDTINGTDVFVRDLKTDDVTKLTVNSAGEMVEGNGYLPSISANGRFVAFHGGNYVSGAEPAFADHTMTFTFVHDRRTGAVEGLPLAAQLTLEEWSNLGGFAAGLDLSQDGRFVATEEEYELDRVTDGTYVRDRGISLGVGSMAPGGQTPALSLEGDRGFSRTRRVVLLDRIPDERSSGLGVSDVTAARLVYRPESSDLFVAIELESMPRTPALAGATAGLLYGLRLEVEGRPLEIRIVTMGLGRDGETVADFGLFACAGHSRIRTCTREADLRGGFGTTGERIVFSLPLRDIGAESGAVLSDIHAFSAIGSQTTGRVRTLDAL